MNKILQTELYNAANKTYKACIENSRVEADMGILIEMSKHGSFVYSENRMISIRSFFDVCEVNQEFSCLIKGREFLNIIKCMKDEIQIEYIEKEQKLSLISGKSKVYLYTNSIKKLPQKSNHFNIKGSCVVNLSKLNEIKHNISTNADSRLKSVHIFISNQETMLEATNGRGFSVRGNNKGLEFIIEAKYLNIILDIAEDNKITLNYGEYESGALGIIINVNNSIISIPLEEQHYFPLDEWKYKKDKIPQGTGYIILNRQELIDALKLMNSFADYVQFNIENNKPLLINSIGVYGESSAIIGADTNNFLSRITVNYEIKALLESLNSLEDEIITCYLKGKLSGFHIIGDNYYEYLSAVS